MAVLLNEQPGSYFDPAFRIHVVKLCAGELYITDRADEMVATVLGSCVAACVRDPVAQVAAINHFMLPEADISRVNEKADLLRYGNHAMRLLIDGLLDKGARLNRLEVKVFGGGNVMSGASVGEANAKWVVKYLAGRGLPIAAQNLGGIIARRVHYFPATGLVLMRPVIPGATTSIRLRKAIGRNDANGQEERIL
jgi:chemotaxis protein CheD